MKELELNLTNLSQTPYSRGGDIFMVEPGQGETGSQGSIGETPLPPPVPVETGGAGASQPPGGTETGAATPAGEPEGERPGGEQEGRETLSSILSDLRQRIIDYDQQRLQGQSNVGEAASLMSEVRVLIDQFPVVEASGIPHELLELASYFRETREELINRILFKAYQDPTETNSYQESMNLYAQSNLDTLLGYLSKQDPTRHEYFFGLRTAANLFHTMNATLSGGNLDEFISIAERINYQHFGLMRDIRGVPEVMRLYEEKYNKYLGRDRRISTEGYEALRQEVERSLRLENQSGLVRSEYENERVGQDAGEMKEWELQRALNVGRTFFNITFRAAEKIATGQVPRKEKDKGTEGHKRFASFPQESAVRIMNWIQWMTYRFDVAGSRGGQKFLEMVKDNYFKFLEQKRRHLKQNKLVEFGGLKTDELEVGAMFGVSGIYSAWRLENMAFPQIKIQIDGRETTIREWLDGTYNSNSPEAERISRFTKIEQIRDQATELIKAHKYDRNLEKNEKFKAAMNNLQTAYDALINPLVDNTNIGLGILLKHDIFSGEIGYRARKRIWERVAQNNLPLMIDYLANIKYEDRTPDNQKAKDINALRGERKQPIIGPQWVTDEEWNTFREKVLLHHERTVKQAMGADISRINIEDYTADETKLIDKIKEAGKQLAPHLADIVFPYVPFMNDVPFELLDYRGPGNEFYRRRTSADIGSFYKAEGAFIAIMTNPGGFEEEEALKQFDAIVKGIESPNGSLDAQERIFPMFDSWLNFVETKPGERQVLFKLGKHVLRKYTSLAQQYSGMDAMSITASQEGKSIDTAVKMGILDRDLANDMKKKKGIGFLGILWEMIRDYFWVPFVSGAFEFGKQTVKEK